MKRRSFLLQTSAAITAGAVLPRASAATVPDLRYGTCRLGFADAKAAGLDGVELRIGEAADRLEIAGKPMIDQQRALMKETGLPVCSLMMGLLNSNPLATDPRAPSWLDQSIDAAQIHFKNGPKYLDEQPAKFEPIAAAIKETRYRGWLVLETSAPSRDDVADARRNGSYLRSLFKNS